MTPRGIRPVVRATSAELAAVPEGTGRTDGLLSLEEAIGRHQDFLIAECEAVLRQAREARNTTASVKDEA